MFSQNRIFIPFCAFFSVNAEFMLTNVNILHFLSEKSLLEEHKTNIVYLGDKYHIFNKCPEQLIFGGKKFQKHFTLSNKSEMF